MPSGGSHAKAASFVHSQVMVVMPVNLYVDLRFCFCLAVFRRKKQNTSLHLLLFSRYRALLIDRHLGERLLWMSKQASATLANSAKDMYAYKATVQKSCIQILNFGVYSRHFCVLSIFHHLPYPQILKTDKFSLVCTYLNGKSCLYHNLV